MQQIFYMTRDGRLKEPQSGAEYETTAWPGRIVAVCPRQPGETDDDFGYLAIVELVAVSTATPVQGNAASTQSAPVTRPEPGARQQGQLPPLMVRRMSRLWFQCSYGQRHRYH
jgi:hypothetical protein